MPEAEPTPIRIHIDTLRIPVGSKVDSERYLSVFKNQLQSEISNASTPQGIHSAQIDSIRSSISHSASKAPLNHSARNAARQVARSLNF